MASLPPTVTSISWSGSYVTPHLRFKYSHISTLRGFKPALEVVEGTPLFQGVDTLLADMPGCLKIRLAHAQGDGVLHLAYNIKEFTDTGTAVSLRFYLIMGFSWGNQHPFILHLLTDNGAVVFVFFNTKWVAVLSTDSIGPSLSDTNWAIWRMVLPSMNTVKS